MAHSITLKRIAATAVATVALGASATPALAQFGGDAFSAGDTGTQSMSPTTRTLGLVDSSILTRLTR